MSRRFPRSDRWQTSLLSRPGPLLLAGALLFGLGGCGESDPGPASGAGDDDAPLSSYRALFEGAPANATLPDDNKADAVYPVRYDELVAQQSPVRHQGSRGVCSIFATIGLMEHLYIKAGRQSPDFSEQYLQWAAKFQAQGFPDSEGSSNFYNLQAISQYGIPEESAWPYQSTRWSSIDDPTCSGEGKENEPTRCFTNGEPPEAARQAPKFKLPAGRYINSNSIKAHITGKKAAVSIGIDFFYQAWNHRSSTLPRNLEYWDQGYVTYPNEADRDASHQHRAGHAVVIVGWDDNMEVPMRDGQGNPVLDASGQPTKEKGFYIFKNSWGTAGFGIRNPYGPGYGYLSYKYVAEEGTVYASDVPSVTPGPGPNPNPTPVPTPTARTYASTTVVDIPDNAPLGASSELSVSDAGTLTAVSVTVDITHTYVGDLTVRLVHNGKTAVLQERKGGPDDDLKKTFTVTDFNGLDRAGLWRLEVIDGARADYGTIDGWSLELK